VIAELKNFVDDN